MLDTQSKIRTLSDEDVESYLSASDGSPELKDLKGVIQEENPITPDPVETTDVDDTGVSKKKEIKALSEEDEKSLLENIQVDDEPSTKPKKTKKEIESSISYKDIVAYHVEEGDWDEEVILEDGSSIKLSDIPEEEFTKETYANLLKYQSSVKAQKAIQEEKAQYGQDAAELLEYLKKGGKLENIAELYKQQADIDSIDVTTVDGAIKAIKEYLEATGEDKDDIKDYIEMLQDRGEEVVLRDGAKKKAKLKEAVEEQKREEMANQAEYENQRKIAEAQANQRIRETIYKDSTLTEKERKELDKYRFDYKYDHPQIKGQKINQYFVDFQKVQSDPQKNIELMKAVKAIAEGKGYKDPQKIKNEEVEKGFNFLRKNNTNLKNISTEKLEYSNEKSAVFDIDKFNKLFKNKT